MSTPAEQNPYGRSDADPFAPVGGAPAPSPYGAPSAQPGYGAPQGSTGQPGYGAPQEGGGQPYGALPGYSQPGTGAAPAYGQQAGYPAPPAYGGYPGQPYGGAGFGGSTGTESNGLGLWSLILGILAFFPGFLFLTGIPAIVLGHKARRAVSEGRATNGGFGLAGIIMGWLSVAATLAAILLLVAVINSPEFQEGLQQGYNG